MSVLFGILCPSQPSKLFNEVVWALASSSANNKLSSHHLTLRHWASVVSSAPGVSCGQLGCLFWTVYQLVLAATPAHSDSSQPCTAWLRLRHTLGSEPELRSERCSVPGSGASGAQPRRTARASEVSVTSVVGSLGQASVPGSIWWQRERWGAQPCFPRCGGRGLLAVDCCCCCPLSPSNPLNTIMYPYSIIQPP